LQKGRQLQKFKARNARAVKHRFLRMSFLSTTFRCKDDSLTASSFSDAELDKQDTAQQKSHSTGSRARIQAIK